MLKTRATSWQWKIILALCLAASCCLITFSEIGRYRATATDVLTYQSDMQLYSWIIDVLALLLFVVPLMMKKWQENIRLTTSHRELAVLAAADERIEELKQTLSDVQTIAEAEKIRLGRELHDGLGSILAATKMELMWLHSSLVEQKNELYTKVVSVMANLDEGVMIKRGIVEGLRPGTLASFGFVTAARELIEETADQSNWQLALDLPETDPEISEEAEVALFRVLQESLICISKHAKATHINVKFTYVSNECCELVIEENGIGFLHPDDYLKTSGLGALRGRLHTYGGHISMASVPTQNIRINIVLPL